MDGLVTHIRRAVRQWSQRRTDVRCLHNWAAGGAIAFDQMTGAAKFAILLVEAALDPNVARLDIITDLTRKPEFRLVTANGSDLKDSFGAVWSHSFIETAIDILMDAGIKKPPHFGTECSSFEAYLPVTRAKSTLMVKKIMRSKLGELAIAVAQFEKSVQGLGGEVVQPSEEPDALTTIEVVERQPLSRP